MPAFVSILRGINVSGQKRVEMKILKSLYISLGYSQVETYIQSGNVIFSVSEKIDMPELERRLELTIEKKFGFEVPVLVRTSDQLKDILNSNPFLKEPDIDLEKLHVTFLREEALPVKVEGLHGSEYLPDRFIIKGSEVFVSCPDGYGRTKINNQYFENKLKVNATTRNWRTVNVLARMANSS